MFACLLAGCAAEGGGELDLIPGIGKADSAGYDWHAPVYGGVSRRGFHPQDLVSEQTWVGVNNNEAISRTAGFETGAGQFDVDRHNVFLADFSTVDFWSRNQERSPQDQIRRIRVDVGWGFFRAARDRVARLLGGGEPLEASILLFERRPDSAGTDDPSEQWIFLTAAPLASQPTLVTTVSLERDYLVAVVGNKRAYEEGLDFEVDLSWEFVPLDERPSSEDYENGVDGNVELRLVSASGDSLPGVRVGIGSVGGTTNEDGIVALTGIHPGEYEVKLGPEGLTRGDALRNNGDQFTVSIGLRYQGIFFVRDEDVASLR